jgi:hypothetical protein
MENKFEKWEIQIIKDSLEDTLEDYSECIEELKERYDNGYIKDLMEINGIGSRMKDIKKILSKLNNK